jgi:hypothetical protein
VDEWQMDSNVDDGVLVHQHRTIGERIEAAREGAARLGLALPLFVDGMDDAVSEAFAAWPERIAVIDADASLAYLGEPGPWGFDPDAARQALVAILGA